MATIPANAEWHDGQTAIPDSTGVSLPFSASWYDGLAQIDNRSSGVVYPTGAIPTFIWPL